MGDRIEASWLRIRRDADTTARQASLPLIRALVQSLTELTTAPQRLTIVDVGAGTGANAEWLAPQISRGLSAVGASRMSQHWKLVDHDQALLDARRVDCAGEVDRVSEHEGTIADIPGVLDAGGDGDARASGTAGVIVTCSALLDLLTPPQIMALVAAAVARADAALLAMSVTGHIRIDPADPDDDLVAALFNAHQQRPCSAQSAASEAAAGPSGWRHAVTAFERSGWTVQVAQTPWQLGQQAAILTARLLTERAEAAIQMAPNAPNRRAVQEWLTRRLRQLERAGLEVWVDHADVLALPPRSTSVQMSSPSG